jgi:hypothetical protein
MFLFTPARAFRRRLTIRVRYAYLIHEDLALQGQLRRNLSFAEHAVAQGKDDQAIYQRLHGVAMPTFLSQVLHAELLRWLSIRDTLASLAKRDLLPDGYHAEIKRITPALDAALAFLAIARNATRRALTSREQQQAKSLLLDEDRR